jgi:YqaJ-like viral recombinase domain
MALIEVEQGSAEWLGLRVGIVTGSRVGDVMTKLKRKDAEAAVRANYKTELVCETLTGRSWEHFISREMKWGLENEIFARNAYELHVEGVQSAGSYQVVASFGGDVVQRVGFALHPTIKRFGASPDVLVGKDGLAEFKCPNTNTHIEYIRAGVVPEEYQFQMLAEMACSERQWCDFVSYDPRLPKRLQLFVRRFERDNARIAEMEVEVEKFLSEVDEQIVKLNSSTLVDLDMTLESKLRESLGDA